MVKSTLLLLSCCALCVSVSALDLGKLIGDLIDKMRPQMANIHVPNNLTWTSNEKPNTLANLVINDLETLALESAIASAIPLRLTNLTLTLPTLQVEGYYDFEDVKLPGPITVFGKGELSVGLVDMLFYLDASLDVKGGGTYLAVKKINDVDLYLGNCTLQLENLMGGGPIGEFLNDLFGDVLPDLVRSAPTLIKENADLIIPIINKVLKEIGIPT